jgi:hypothetical protein
LKPVLDPIGPWTAQLTLSGFDGWFVEWVKIDAGNSHFMCPMSDWLDNDANKDNRLEPNTTTVTCIKLGKPFIYITTNRSGNKPY